MPKKYCLTNFEKQLFIKINSFIIINVKFMNLLIKALSLIECQWIAITLNIVFDYFIYEKKVFIYLLIHWYFCWAILMTKEYELFYNWH